MEILLLGYGIAGLPGKKKEKDNNRRYAQPNFPAAIFLCSLFNHIYVKKQAGRDPPEIRGENNAANYLANLFVARKLADASNGIARARPDGLGGPNFWNQSKQRHQMLWASQYIGRVTFGCKPNKPYMLNKLSRSSSRLAVYFAVYCFNIQLGTSPRLMCVPRV